MNEYMPDASTLTTLVGALVTFLGGGAFFRYIIDRKQVGITDRDGIIAELNRLMDNERKECDRKLDELASTNKSLQLRITDLEDAVAQLRKSTIEPPICSWQKNMKGEYIAVNDAALHEIFAPVTLTRGDVIGNTDEKIWGQDVAVKMKECQRAALFSHGNQARCVIKIHPQLPEFTVLVYVVPTPVGPDPLTYVYYLAENSNEGVAA